MTQGKQIIPVALDDADSALVIVDQTLIPNETKYLRLRTQPEIWEAIHTLRVRGAPAIGIAAAYGAYLGVKGSAAADFDELLRRVQEGEGVPRLLPADGGEPVLGAGPDGRVRAAQPGAADCGDQGGLLRRGRCHPGGGRPGQAAPSASHALSLLAARHGDPHPLQRRRRWLRPTTARPWPRSISGQEQGYNFQVFADETRPLLQGARLTAWELMQAGVDVTLICDNMASMVMKKGWVQAVFVGCDRVAANGDTANKIGTSGVAILAKHYGIPFYVARPRPPST